MNGVHDMGGMTDFGPIQREADEPVFHACWEARVRGMVDKIVGEHLNWDEFRFVMERISPAEYLSASYYQRWLTGLEQILVEKGLLVTDDFRHALDGWSPDVVQPVPPRVAEDADRVRTKDARHFKTGDQVTVRNIQPSGYTRVPRYVRGKRGTVERALGVFALPDTNAAGLGLDLEPVYAVRFTARKLWGESASSRDSVCVDLWQSYLRGESNSDA